tara:strand:- start:246 stop:425 length:180 start_codon:yes stop_codon:yes gene_type:complete
MYDLSPINKPFSHIAERRVLVFGPMRWNNGLKNTDDLLRRIFSHIGNVGLEWVRVRLET